MVERPTVPITSVPPIGDTITPYDRAHLVTYLKLLDADALGADWKATARSILSLNPATDLVGAQRIYDAHLVRARWITRIGYRQLLER